MARLLLADLPLATEDRARAPAPSARGNRLCRLIAAPVWAVLLVAPAVFVVPPAVSASAASDTVATELELSLFSLVNADRTAYGIAPLAWAADLLEVARARAAAEVPLPAQSHTGASGGVALVPLLLGSGVPSQTWGENLVRLPGPDTTTAQRAEEALMSSPDHRENLLYPAFDHLAVGAATDAGGRVVLAQVFRAADPG